MNALILLLLGAYLGGALVAYRMTVGVTQDKLEAGLLWPKRVWKGL